MSESDLHRVYTYPKNPRLSRIYSDKGFVEIDNGSQGGTHWACFVIKDSKSYYFDTFEGTPDKVLLKPLSKPKIYHNYKIQVINSRLFGSYCLCFFCLIERMKY